MFPNLLLQTLLASSKELSITVSFVNSGEPYADKLCSPEEHSLVALV